MPPPAAAEEMPPPLRCDAAAPNNGELGADPLPSSPLPKPPPPPPLLFVLKEAEPIVALMAIEVTSVGAEAVGAAAEMAFSTDMAARGRGLPSNRS